MKKTLNAIFILFFTLIIFYGCEDRSDLVAPPELIPVSGDANLTRYVAIGNSLTAGYQSSSLFQTAQVFSYPKLIANQAGIDLVQPLISDPGIGGQMQIVSLSPFVIKTAPLQGGTPLNLNHPAPYGNLGIPGIVLEDVMNSTASASSFSKSPFIDIILRGLGTQFQQAKSLQPTFVTLWIGNNDVLGFAASGGVKPAEPTPTGTFAFLYNQLADSLAATGAKVVVANIPSVTSIPFLTTVGPQMAFAIPWGLLTSLGAPGLFIQKHGQTVNPTSFVDSVGLLTGSVLVPLTGSSYASLLGQSTGKFYKDNGFPALPAGIDTTQPFGFHPQNPWPDALILDGDEIATANIAVTAFNDAIFAAATRLGFGLVDINSFFNSIRLNDFAGGTTIDGINFKTTYITGGLFSLDGVHPSSQGQGVIANKFIETINSKFNANFKSVDIGAIPGSLNFVGKISFKNGYPVIPKEVFEQLLF